QVEFLDLAKKRRVAVVGARPSALDIVDAEIVEALGNLELVLDRERDVLRLTPVAQRGVVDLYFFRHSHVPRPTPPVPRWNFRPRMRRAAPASQALRTSHCPRLKS